MGYNTRKQLGNQFESDIRKSLEERHIHYELTGIERRQIDPASEAYHQMPDNERYAPDFFLPLTDTFIEAKTSKCIERCSYQNAIELEHDGFKVFFCLRVGGQDRWLRATEIVFQQPTPENNPMRLPTDGVWRNPGVVSGEWTAENVKDWKRRLGSGKEFAVALI